MTLGKRARNNVEHVAVCSDGMEKRRPYAHRIRCTEQNDFKVPQLTIKT